MFKWNFHEQYAHGLDGPLRQKLLEKGRCFMCNENWENSASLNIHMRKCHSFDRILGRLYQKGDALKCDHCFDVFTVTSKKALMEHLLRIHFPSNLKFKCKICYRTFRSNMGLEKHKEKHTIVFNCKLCSKTFNRKWDFVEHIKAVHEEKFKCDKCQKVLADKQSLNYHTKMCLAKLKAPELKLKNEKLLEVLRKLSKIRSEIGIPLDTKCNYASKKNLP